MATGGCLSAIINLEKGDGKMSEPTLNGMTRKEIVRAWIGALESGEYKQGQGYLCQVNGDKRNHCCLGVLCEVARIPSIEMAVDEAVFEPVRVVSYGGPVRVVDCEGSGYSDEGNYYRVCLPIVLVNFMGMDRRGALSLDTDDASLAAMNDDRASFEDIADVVRQGRVKGLEDAPKLLENI